METTSPQKMALLRETISMCMMWFQLISECLKLKKSSFWKNIYNVGYNNGTSVLKIITECKKIFKDKLKYKYVEKKRGIIQRSIASNIKFKKK